MILSDIDNSNHDLNSLDYLTNHPYVEVPPHVGAEVMAENLEDSKSNFQGKISSQVKGGFQALPCLYRDRNRQLLGGGERACVDISARATFRTFAYI